MILNFVGLVLSFVGSVILVASTLFNYTREKSYVQVIYPNNPEKREVNRYSSKHKPIKITGEEIIMFFSLVLICLGFLLQILDLTSLGNLVEKFINRFFLK